VIILSKKWLYIQGLIALTLAQFLMKCHTLNFLRRQSSLAADILSLSNLCDHRQISKQRQMKKLKAVAAFESCCLVNTEQYSSHTVFVNFLMCCTAIPLTCSTHWLVSGNMYIHLNLNFFKSVIYLTTTKKCKNLLHLQMFIGALVKPSILIPTVMKHLLT